MSNQKKVIEVFEENYKRLSKLAIMTVKDSHAALDVMQNVALILITKENQLNDIDNITAFLATCVRRAALNHIRDSSRAYPTDPTKLDEMHKDIYSNITIDYVEWVMLLEKCLVTYSPVLQNAFIKHYINGYPLDTLAKGLEMTPNALSQQFKRMRKKIASQSPKYHMLLMILSLL